MNRLSYILPIAIVFLVFISNARADIVDLDLNELYNNTGTNSTQPTFKFRIVLNGSSANASCELLINNTGYGVNSSVINNTETNITVNSTFSDGLYTWKMNCTTNDLFNLKSYERLFYIDTTPPTVNFTQPTPDNGETISLTNANSSVTINITYSDNTEIISCLLTRNGRQYPMEIYNGYCLLNNQEWEEGSNTIKATAIDKGGNQAETEERTITIDALTRADTNSLFWLFPIVILAIAAITGLGILTIYDEISVDTTLTIMLAVLILTAFAGILIVLGGEVI